MTRHRWFAYTAAGIALLFTQAVARAWNSTGHRAVAYIAYKQLKQNDPETLKQVLDVLRTHPAATTPLWTSAW